MNEFFQNKLVQNPINKDLAFDEINKEYPPSVPISDTKKWFALLEPVSTSLGIRQPDFKTFLQSGISGIFTKYLSKTNGFY